MADGYPTALSPLDRVIKIASNANIPPQERREIVRQIDPHGRLMQPAVAKVQAEYKDALRRTADARRDLEQKKANFAMHSAAMRSLDLYKDWEYEETARFVLERNENTRVHRLHEAADAGLIFDGASGEFSEPRKSSPMFSESKVFVVRHDWAAAFENSEMDGAEYRLPFQLCLFEFRVTGKTVVIFAWDQQVSDTVPPRGHTVFLEGVDGVWLNLGEKATAELSDFLWRQIRAICVALDAQIAEHQVVRAPHALNQKRAKAGKPPLRDFHVVDLSRRIRAASRTQSTETGRKVRMHFRRGHWRHYETHKTWINWMLVGNPDLGFIDKHYRI